MPVTLDTPKPWTDTQLREFYKSCSPKAQAYIDRLNNDRSGRDLADIISFDAHMPRTCRAAAHAYFCAEDAPNPYRDQP